MDTRLRILKEAGLMFSRYGIRSITMDNIANELGISKRTLYEIFIDKDDLVSQSIAEGASEHKKMCYEIISESENVIEAIFRIGKLNNELFGKMNPLFFEDLKKFHSEVFTKIDHKGLIRDFSLTHSLFTKGVEDGVISDKINIEVVNVFVHKIIDIIHTEEMKSFKNDEILQSAFLPYLIGISTDKGRELIAKYFISYQ